MQFPPYRVSRMPLHLILALTLAGCGGGSKSDPEKALAETTPSTPAVTTAEAASAPEEPASAASAPASSPSADAATAPSGTAQATGPTRRIQASTALAGATTTATSTSSTTASPAGAATVPIQTAGTQTTTASATEVLSSNQLPAASSAFVSSAESQLKALSATQGVLLQPRLATENWGAAKATTKANASWNAWLAANQAILRTWFSKTRDKASFVAGYPNGLIDPKTGAAVKWTMDMAEPPTGTNAAEIAYKAAWIAINRQYNIARSLDAARQYLITGDKTFADIAASQLDFYADNYQNWPLRTAIGNARMFGQSLDEATAVIELLETARALRSYADPARYQRWRDKLFYPIATNVQTYAWGALNNINMWCAVATASIGLTFSNQALIDAGTTGSKGITAVLTQGVTQDGIWYEGSFAYNNYVLAALARFFDIAAIENRNDLTNPYVSRVQKMLLAPILFRFEDGSLPSPSDTRAPVQPVDTQTHLAFYRHVPTSFGIAEAAKIKQWQTLIDPPAAQTTTPTLPKAMPIDSSDTRMAMLRQGTWQLFVHYGQKTVNHAQEEALTYELVHGTTSITRDAGTATSYTSPYHVDYFSKGLGNNTPLIDGAGQSQWALGQVQNINLTTGELDILHQKYRPDYSAYRSFRLSPNGFTETTKISTTSIIPTAKRLGVVFHTPCTIQATDPRLGPSRSSAPPFSSAGFSYWTNIARFTPQESWSLKLTCNQQVYEYLVSGPKGQSLYIATSPSTPLPATRQSIYIEIGGTEAVFTSTIKAVQQ